MRPALPLETLFRITETQKRALHTLGIKTAEDVLHHFPSRYGDAAEVRTIEGLQRGDTAVVYGKISKLKATKAFYKKIPMGTAELCDDTGKIKIIWFNQPYLAKMIPEGALVRVDGKVSEKRGKGGLYFSNPKIEKIGAVPNEVGRSLFGNSAGGHHLYPVYPESRGITSNWFYHAIQKIFRTEILDALEDSIPPEILKKYSLPSLQTALIWIHAPKNRNDALAARKRFAFEEVFFIQLDRQKARKEYEANPSYKITAPAEGLKNFEGRFPWKPTAAQTRAVKTILSDFNKERPMMRLLEGDVGSGKTFVAAATSYSVVTSRPAGQNFGNLQVAYMCPTEILAVQQFENFISFFSHLSINIGLITSSGCRKFPSKVNLHEATDISRTQLLKWVAGGEIPILIGTHALIQKAVSFKHLAYVIIDEQHRFGVGQRQRLVQKNRIAPHLMSMTATPIPRTLSLTIFGDLDLTLLDEMPPGRKPIITEIVLKNEREATYEKIRRELLAGRQAYTICPRIDEPDPTKETALLAKSVKEEARRLKEKIFPEFEVGLLHGKMKPAEKGKVMEEFRDGKIKILVSTSVVEVGVNIPNATIIVIEGAERFGLAQLHQLRGRVLRSTHQSYCYIFTETAGKATRDRLKAIKEAKNGFELAEYDLKFRGAGELSGSVQWGVSDVAMEALQNLKMVEAARAEAKKIIEEDPDLSRHPMLSEKISDETEKIHFE